MNRNILGIAVVAALLAVGVVPALAAIPDSNGIITVCYGGPPGGPRTMRLIDTEATPPETCTTNETKLFWNQRGPQGPVGPAGPTGPQGPAGPGEIVRLRVVPVNGFVVLPDLGVDNNVQGISCTGAAPTGGPNIPGMVVANLRPTDTQLRIIRNNGTAINGVTVLVNCAVDRS